jgi:hypothetical protein
MQSVARLNGLSPRLSVKAGFADAVSRMSLSAPQPDKTKLAKTTETDLVARVGAPKENVTMALPREARELPRA